MQDYAGGAITWTAQNLQAYALYLEKCVLCLSGCRIELFCAFCSKRTAIATIPIQPVRGLRQTCVILSNSISVAKFASDNVPAQIWLSTINNVSFSTAIAPSLSDPECRKYVSGRRISMGRLQRGYEHPIVSFIQKCAILAERKLNAAQVQIRGHGPTANSVIENSLLIRVQQDSLNGIWYLKRVVKVIGAGYSPQ